MADWGEVIKITEILQIGPTGNLDTFYRVQARTKGGTLFSKVVSEAETKAEAINKILSEKATQLDKVLKV